MGIDLTLCPMPSNDPSWWLGYDRLSLKRNYSLFAQMGDMQNSGYPAPVLEPLELPQGTRFDWYGDEGIEELKTDPYGCELTYLRAHDFLKLKLDPENMHPWNLAVIKFIQALPPETPVVLWWH